MPAPGPALLNRKGNTMSIKFKILAFPLFLALALALTAQPAQAAACSLAPIVEVLPPEPDWVMLRFDDRCTGEAWSRVLARNLNGTWSVILNNQGEHTGWRYAVHNDGLQPGNEYCYKAQNSKDGIVKTSATVCITTPQPKVKLGVGTFSLGCGTRPRDPEDAISAREHAYISWALAWELGIDESHVQPGGPGPQIRITVDSPLMANGAKSSVNYTVAGICYSTGIYDWRLWLWNMDKFFLPSGTNPADVSLTLAATAPSRTTWTDNGSATNTEDHFTEPNASGSGQKFFREKVAMVDNKEVALLVPHGGGIERSTSEQGQAFVSEIGTANVNVWEAQGQWGDNQTDDRWHITAVDIHEDGFPGLARLLAEPELNDTQNQDFRYAVALHGFGDTAGVGLILGGLAPADVLCHVAQGILDEAGTRAGEIGLHIANAGTNGADIQRANALGYIPNPANLEDLEGTAQDNILNRVSRAQTPGSSTVAWGGIQLEQSLALRREMDYDFADADGDDVNDFCTSNESECLHNIVARGVARAVAELVDDVAPVDPAGACCTHFGQRCQ